MRVLFLSLFPALGDLSDLGAHGSTDPGSSSTPPHPVAAAERIKVPKFPGSKINARLGGLRKRRRGVVGRVTKVLQSEGQNFMDRGVDVRMQQFMI
jgi:hypothetical protein